MNQQMDPEVVEIDYNDENQTGHLLQLLNEYATEPMGGGEPIPTERHPSILAGLKDFPTAFSYLVYIDQSPAALANCFFGFSTFAGKRLINIHDLMVSKVYRGQGLSQLLLQTIEQRARETNCCKITLEVLSNNEIAKNSYKKFGFDGYELDPTAGEAIFWQKKLD